MKTLKSILILNQLSNSHAVLMPSYTGEYLTAETNYGSLDEPNIAFDQSEPWINFPGDKYTPIQRALKELGWDSLAYIPTSEIQEYFTKLSDIFTKQIKWSIKHSHIGDDTFSDYLPDLYEMIQYAAYGLLISSNEFNNKDIQTLMQPLDDLITEFDQAFPQTFPEDETLRDQCSEISIFEFLALNKHLTD